MTKIYKYHVLQKEMLSKHENTVAMGKILGITGRAVQNKLDGITQWSINEIDILCDHYNMNYYELFKKED